MPPTAVVIDKELMITDLSVVNDARTVGPNGHWSFGHLMREMSGSTDPARVKAFVLNWLKHWDTPQSVNGFSVAAKPRLRTDVIEPWKVKDGQPGVSDDLWQMNLANAPFRLLAIVNRMDLNRGIPTRVDSAGEGRFVFGVLGPPPANAALPFTVIFEYELLATDREKLRGWAQAWHTLGSKPFGPDYNQALQVITDRFSKAGGAPSKPNGNAINQIRTNEIALGAPWELREFNVGTDGQLHQVTVKQTPANAFKDNPTENQALGEFINLRTPELLDGSLTLHDKLDDGTNFLGGSSLVPINFFWNAPGIANNEARHKLAFITCNGCHHVEVGTTNFLHVANRAPNEQARLSGFLTGKDASGNPFKVPDPVQPTVFREFHDLADRAEILKLLADEPGAIRLESLQRSRAARVH